MPEEKQNQTQPKPEQPTGRSLIPAIIFSVLFTVLRESALSTPVAMMITATVVFLPAYWFPPRPPMGFLRYAVGIELMIIGFVVAYWPIPKLLREIMSVQLAYALPSLLLSLALYLHLRVFPRNQHIWKVGFAKWALGCVVFALLVAGAVTVLPPS